MPTARYGDFADAWTSPNDPIFFPHHANVDRNLMAWQSRHGHSAPTYGFPTVRGPLAPGHALHDVIAPADPFEVGALFNLSLLAGSGVSAGAAGALRADALLTNEALLALTTPDVAPYEYDTFDAWSRASGQW